VPGGPIFFRNKLFLPDVRKSFFGKNRTAAAHATPAESSNAVVDCVIALRLFSEVLVEECQGSLKREGGAFGAVVVAVVAIEAVAGVVVDVGRETLSRC